MIYQVHETLPVHVAHQSSGYSISPERQTIDNLEDILDYHIRIVGNYC